MTSRYSNGLSSVSLERCSQNMVIAPKYSTTMLTPWADTSSRLRRDSVLGDATKYVMLIARATSGAKRPCNQPISHDLPEAYTRSNGEVEGPADRVSQARRARNFDWVPPCLTTSASRPPPTIVRSTHSVKCSSLHTAR